MWFPNPVSGVLLPQSTSGTCADCNTMCRWVCGKAVVRPLPVHTSQEPFPQSLVWMIVGKMVLTLLTLQLFFSYYKY